MWDLIVSVPDHCLSFYFDQTGWMPRLILIFAGRTYHFVCFVMRRLNYH